MLDIFKNFVAKNHWTIIVLLLTSCGLHQLFYHTPALEYYKLGSIQDPSEQSRMLLTTFIDEKDQPIIYQGLAANNGPTYLYVSTPEFEVIEDDGSKDGITDYSLIFYIHYTDTTNPIFHNSPHSYFVNNNRMREFGEILAGIYSRYSKQFMRKVVENPQAYSQMLKDNGVVGSLNEIAYQLQPEVGTNCFDDIIIQSIVTRK